MCVLFGTTKHPNYKLILVSNRDELFERKTHISQWNKNGKVLYPYDMTKDIKGNSEYKEEHGTWCGINREGKIAILLNLINREEGEMERNTENNNVDDKMKDNNLSRGEIPINYLCNEKYKKYEEWDTYDKFKERVKNGDENKKFNKFNLFYGDIKNNKYDVINSNGKTRNLKVGGEGEDFCFSNIDWEDIELVKEWSKIKKGIKLIKGLISLEEEENIIEECFKIGSLDECKIDKLNKFNDTKELIFIPPLKIDSKRYYGTRSQIVILCERGDSNKVIYIERVLHCSDLDADKKVPIKEVRYKFDII